MLAAPGEGMRELQLSICPHPCFCLTSKIVLLRLVRKPFAFSKPIAITCLQCEMRVFPASSRMVATTFVCVNPIPSPDFKI